MEHKQHVRTVHLDVPRTADASVWLLYMADVHWDNPACRRDLLKRHLDQARARDAQVFVFGDLFCAMQGKYDKRAHKAGIRPEHNVDNYLDAIVDDAAAWWSPWAERVSLVSPGNHETSILRRNETDLTARFVETLRGHYGATTEAGTYQGWIRNMTADKSYRQAIKTRYHHGHGGGGVVTKGTLWPQRRAAWWPDADIIVTGHIHEQWSFPVTRERLTSSGRIVTDTQLHLSLPTYKDEQACGGGWAVEGGQPPKPLGAYWVRVYWDCAAERYRWSEERAV